MKIIFSFYLSFFLVPFVFLPFVTLVPFILILFCPLFAFSNFCISNPSFWRFFCQATKLTVQPPYLKLRTHRNASLKALIFFLHVLQEIQSQWTNSLLRRHCLKATEETDLSNRKWYRTDMFPTSDFAGQNEYAQGYQMIGTWSMLLTKVETDVIN